MSRIQQLHNKPMRSAPTEEPVTCLDESVLWEFDQSGPPVIAWLMLIILIVLIVLVVIAFGAAIWTALNML